MELRTDTSRRAHQAGLSPAEVILPQNASLADATRTRRTDIAMVRRPKQRQQKALCAAVRIVVLDDRGNAQ